MARETLSPTEARQASPRRLNFRVLVASLLMAVVVGAVLYAVFYGGQTQMSSPEPATAPSTAPVEPTPTTPAPNPQP